MKNVNELTDRRSYLVEYSLSESFYLNTTLSEEWLKLNIGGGISTKGGIQNIIFKLN